MNDPSTPDLLDVRLLDVPGYFEWSRLYVNNYPALIAHLDATSMLLTTAELNAGIRTEVFDEMLDELKAEFGE